MTVEEWLGSDNIIGIDNWNKKYKNGDETFDQWLDRVSGGDETLKQLIIEKKFLFGGRILANRGIQSTGRKTTYSNCYVVKPVEDSIEDIFQCANDLARTYSYGGGCGVDISKLAPRGAKINNAAKETSGAVSFMELFDTTTNLIGQNGRRGALMISISCEHPDVEEFIDVKNDLSKITKANISLRITDEFMTAVRDDLPYTLKYIREATGEILTKVVRAKDLFQKIIESNWRMGEPGVLFWDNIEKWNMLYGNPNFKYGGVNPCAEEPLPPGGSCLLGSINLSEFITAPFTKGAHFEFCDFVEAVRGSVVALNNVLDEGIPLHPLQSQRESVSQWRQIGLGIMGLADCLIKLGIKYGSQDAIKFCDDIARLMALSAIIKSCELAEENGPYAMCSPESFDNAYFKYLFDGDEETLQRIKEHGLRNSQLLTIAPTGTLSTMLGISGGIEPIFANSYTRKTESLHGKDYIYKIFTPIVMSFMKETSLDEEFLPEYFVTATTISTNERIAMQSIWQKYIDAAISSTVNLPESATPEDIGNIYMEAWKNGLKGITVFRANCERTGILIETKDKKEDEPKEQNIRYIADESDLPRGYVADVPEGISYRKHKIQTGCGRLYLFVGVDPVDNKIYDCFTTTDGVGGCQIQTASTSRLISACLRSGTPLVYIIEQLQKSGTCPSFQYKRGAGKSLSKGKSCPSAIAYILEDIMKEFEEAKKNEDCEELDVDDVEEEDIGDIRPSEVIAFSECPQCHKNEMVHDGGCVICKSCGYSKCG